MFLLASFELFIKLFNRFVIEYVITITADDIHLEWLCVSHNTDPNLLLSFILIHSLLLIKLLEFESKLLSMLLLKLLIRDLLEAQTVIPFVVDRFNQVLLERFGLVFLPEVFDLFSRTLWEDPLPFDSLKVLHWNFLEGSCTHLFIKSHSFDDRNSLSLANIQLQCLIRVIAADLVLVHLLQSIQTDAVFDPGFVIDWPEVKVVEVELSL